MDNYPLVTVITPSYNHVKYIEQAIESIANQTYPNIEYIIIDDGSSDGTHKLLNSLSEKYTNFKFILHADNKGHSRINEGVELAKGKYISLLSSDDWYLPEKIEKQVELFQKLPKEYGVVYCGGLRYFMDTLEYQEAPSNKNMQRGEILKSLLTSPFFIYPISPLARKECFIRYPFSGKYKAEGEAIYFKIAMMYKFDYLNENLVVMRDHSNNIGKNIEVMLADNLNYRKELFLHPDFPENLKSLKGEILSRIYFLKGWEFLRIEKKYKEGNENLKKAYRLNPRYVFNIRFIIGLFYSSIRIFIKK